MIPNDETSSCSLANVESPFSKEEKKQSPQSLEQKLFSLLKQHHVRNPSVKEFNECWAFAKALQSFYTRSSIRVILDVAGGHGALGAILLLLFPKATHAVVIDPAARDTTQLTSVQRAWNELLVTGDGDTKDMRLSYRAECLRSALPDAIQQFTSDKTSNVHPSEVLVVACHACQHLSEETANIACSMGTHIALMPCCQKDHLGSFKAFANSLQIPIGTIMDILLAGKCQSWTNTGPSHNIRYQVKMRTIDSKITPQNRMILCKAQYVDACRETHPLTLHERKYATAHTKLQAAYQRAHGEMKNKVRDRNTLNLLGSRNMKQSLHRMSNQPIRGDKTTTECQTRHLGHNYALAQGFLIGCTFSALVFYFCSNWYIFSSRIKVLEK
jgi:hypothetical protein